MVARQRWGNDAPLQPKDLRFNRGVALGVLLLGAIFVYSLAFSSFDERVRFQWDVQADVPMPCWSRHVRPSSARPHRHHARHILGAIDGGR